ncbi:hypothetical protein BD410DRAFT_787192 [Rickenella mellea]|uniref:DUF6533 domain-containing protein n=1 Tax=Rickenella mellea TaxID=50990 RepID=A0A4Y7Q7I0_9AGAM|nr:hypothetical protein BD410DRAFT_787192 [Rickenella mellea]
MFQEAAALDPSIVEIFFHLQVVKYVTVAALTLLVWDYLITLSDEVTLVWPSRWRIPKYLFFINRYLAITDPMMLSYILIFATDPKVCVAGFRTLGGFATTGFLVAQLILVMRTFAVWGSKWNKYTYGFIAIFLCAVGVDLWAVHSYLLGVTSTGVPTKGMTGCALHFANRNAWITFLLVMLDESTFVILLSIKAWQHFQNGRSRLMVGMYNDGLLHFACILASSIANLITVVVAPVELHSFLIVVQRVMHSVLCNRVLLHIRGAYQATDTFTTISEQSIPPLSLHPIRNRKAYYNDSLSPTLSEVQVHVETTNSVWR